MSVALSASFKGKLWPLYIPLCVLVAHACSYLPYISDDALISLRYADRLINGYGLTWSTGHAVEGYSNLAWILLVSLLGSLGIDLIIAARLLGITCMALVLLVNYRLWISLLEEKQLIYLIVAQFAFAFSGTIAIWAIGGLEQPLAALCVILAIYYLFAACQNNLNTAQVSKASLSLGVLCLTRPDSPLICVALAMSILLIHGIKRQTFLSCCKLAQFPIIFLGLQIAFRLSYYGEWLPNTALIKMTPSWHYISVGVLYVLSGLILLGPLSYFSIQSLLKNFNHKTEPVKSALSIIISAVLIAWCAYVAFIGGDILPGFRHLVISITLLVIAFPLSAGYLSSSKKYQSRKAPLILATLYLTLQLFSPFNIWARFELWHWDGEVIANVLKTAFRDEKPLIAVDGAGTLPYFTSFPAIDMLGLNDYHIARTTPAENKSWFVGHAFSDVDYVLDKKPDIIDYCYRPDADKVCTTNAWNMFNSKRFHDSYHSVYLLGYEPHEFAYKLWFRKDSPKVGIKQFDDFLEIPSYFLGHENGSPVYSYLNSENQLVIDIEKNQPLSYTIDELLNDIHHIEPVPYDIKLNAKIYPNGKFLIHADGDEIGRLEAIRIY